MARYQIVTLVDITRSQPSRVETSSLKLGQQSNFNSLVQSIGLRSNISWKQDPKKDNGALPNNMEGKATYWIWEFDTERDDVFLKDKDPTGLLLEDLHGVPIISNLTNSVDIDPAVFQTQGKNINTWIDIIV